MDVNQKGVHTDISWHEACKKHKLSWKYLFKYLQKCIEFLRFHQFVHRCHVWMGFLCNPCPDPLFVVRYQLYYLVANSSTVYVQQNYAAIDRASFWTASRDQSSISRYVNYRPTGYCTWLLYTRFSDAFLVPFALFPHAFPHVSGCWGCKTYVFSMTLWTMLRSHGLLLFCDVKSFTIVPCSCRIVLTGHHFMLDLQHFSFPISSNWVHQSGWTLNTSCIR